MDGIKEDTMMDIDSLIDIYNFPITAIAQDDGLVMARNGSFVASGTLQRINDELLAVANFSDWNPSHFLDVAEMSLAVAIALDWTAGDLPESTIALAQKALIEKGLKPSFARKHGWIRGTNNWNQVCHGGMVAAAIAIAERDPELAAKTISRALEGMPYVLNEYGPDGNEKRRYS